MICREISESRVNLQKQKSGTYADLLELLLEVRPPPLSKPLKQKLFGFGARVGIERGSFTVPSLTHSVFAAIAIVIPDLSISRLLKQQKMEPAVRIELTTHGLQNRCSTAELSWRLHIQHLLPCPVSCQACRNNGSGSIWWGERPREPGLMGFIAKIGSPGVSPHQSWLGLHRFGRNAGFIWQNI